MKYNKLTNYQIKKIIKCFCADLNATQTGILLDFNRKTINRYYLIFRRCIYKQQQESLVKFFGTVELDESYFGYKRVRGVCMPPIRGRGTWKQPVFGIFERNGQVYTEIIPDGKRETLRRAIMGKVSIHSVIITDGWRGYNGLVDVGYDKHLRVDKTKGFTNGKGVHINGIESFWSFTKRRLSRFNGIKKYFDLHLKESEWRWKKNQGEMEKELWRMLLKYG
jgi:transposase-like protein